MPESMTNITFKEYLELDSDYETLMSLSENNFYKALRVLDSGPMFAAGTAGNLIGQTLRGTGNIASGGIKALTGLGSSTAGALQYLGGNKEAKEKAKSRIRSGFGRVADGAGNILRGATQIVTSPITAPIRGAQAMDDDSISGILAPNDPKRGYWQDLFGLASGINEPEQPEPEAEKTKQKTTQSINPEKVRAARAAVVLGSKQASSDQTADYLWLELVKKLKSASSTKEAVHILSYMKRNFSTQYEDALKTARSLSRGRPSTNPSGRLRSVSTKRKPF